MRIFTQAMQEHGLEIPTDYQYQYNTGFTAECYNAAAYMTQLRQHLLPF